MCGKNPIEDREPAAVDVYRTIHRMSATNRNESSHASKNFSWRLWKWCGRRLQHRQILHHGSLGRAVARFVVAAGPKKPLNAEFTPSRVLEPSKC
jgi:hypothetical protein